MTFRRIVRRALGSASVAVIALAGSFTLVAPGDALALGEPAAEVSEKPRLAFVIGNSEYANLNKLRNPVNDGKLIAATLERLNFKVVEGYDLDLAGMYALFNDNKALIDSAEAVVVYYAGHGFQFGGTNYLVPVDAAFETPDKAADETMTLDGLVKLLEDDERPLFLFLDACRNNPLKIADGADGLAQVTSGTNTFVTFATEPGRKTADGAGVNSPFAKALAQSLEIPGLSIMSLDIAVREETLELTAFQQKTWAQQSLLTDFYFSERQKLNPNAVLMAANTILTSGTESQRNAFQLDMEELGLQGAVMRAQQREVQFAGLDLYAAPTPAAAPAAPAAEPATLELASGSAPPPTPTAPALDAAPATLLFASRGPTAGGAAAPPEEFTLARQLQTELRRLGCYAMTIDGDWGRGSRGALEKYYREKGLPTGDLEPTTEALNRALLDSGRICRAPVQVQRAIERRNIRAVPTAEVPTRRKVASRPAEEGPRKVRPTKPQRQMTKTVQSFRTRPAQGQSTPARQARAEQRRDVRNQIRGGFGIGGF